MHHTTLQVSNPGRPVHSWQKTLQQMLLLSMHAERTCQEAVTRCIDKLNTGVIWSGSEIDQDLCLVSRRQVAICHRITMPLSHARPKSYRMPVVIMTASDKGLLRQFEEDVQKLSTLASTKTFAWQVQTCCSCTEL